MKKVLIALVLVAVMAFGVSGVSASAADLVTTYSDPGGGVKP